MKYLLIAFMLLNASVEAQTVTTDIVQMRIFPFRSKTGAMGSDTSTLIESKNYSGIILSKNCNGCLIEIGFTKDRLFLPSLEEVKEAEDSLGKIYDQVNLYGKSRFAVNALRDITPYFSNYKRQYLGIINEKKEKTIYINFLDFKDLSEAEKNFHDWKHKFIIGFDGIYEYGMASFEYNLSTKMLTR